MKQYTITEYNDNEDEYYSYIMNLSERQYQTIHNKIDKDCLDEYFSIMESEYTDKDVETINENSYMERINFYKFRDEDCIYNWNHIEDVFYNGNGLIKLSFYHTENYKFKIGDKVYKPKGYKFPSTVVSIFKTISGEVRVVAELDDYGMLHIFNENQLELR